MNAKDPKGYYAILGVSVDADTATIMAAYRRRAMELHPDRNTSPNAARQFQLLNEAHATLNDPTARGEYDTMSLDTAKESAATTSEKPEPIVCSCCGKVSAQPRYAIFFEVKSFIVATTRSPVQGIFCSACAEKKVVKASALTWLLGWWGFPWGPIFSIHALWNNMLGGKRPALINARLAAHQAWFFAATGRTEMAHAVAFDAMSLARKIPPDATTRKPATGRDMADEGIKLRAQIQRLLDSLGTSGGKRLKSNWYWARRPFFVQAAMAVLSAGSVWYWVNNASLAYEPPRGPKPYQVEPQSATASREPAFPVSPPISSSSSWVRPATAPNGEPWPTVASYLRGLPRTNFGGLSSVTIDNSGNDSDVFVKLVSLDGPAARPVRFFFIPAHGRFTTEQVTAGTYDVRYRDLSQGSLARSEQFSVEETRTLDGTQYSNITMTLYKIRNGNMRTYNLAEDEF
jgi:hypothetical protein